MNLFARRRALWDFVGGALWVLPTLSVLLFLTAGAMLSLVSVLICLIHHLARSIQIDTIMSQVEREARWVIDDLYPEQPGYLEPEQRCPDPPASATALPAGRSGYIQAVQPKPLIRVAADQDVVVRLASQGGDHVVEGTPPAWAWPRLPDGSPVGLQLVRAALDDAVIIGFERTMVQDAPSGCVVWSTSATRPCRRRSTIPTRASRRFSTCRCCVHAGRPAARRPALPR